MARLALERLFGFGIGGPPVRVKQLTQLSLGLVLYLLIKI